MSTLALTGVDAHGCRWAFDHTLCIRTRYRDSPRGGLRAAVLDYEIVDKLTGQTRYEYTLARARQTAADIVVARPTLEWQPWQGDHSFSRTRDTGRTVRISVGTLDDAGWRPITIKVLGSGRVSEWLVPLSMRRARAQAQTWGAYLARVAA